MPIPDDIREHYPDCWPELREWLRGQTVGRSPAADEPGTQHHAGDAPCCEWCGVPELDGDAVRAHRDEYQQIFRDWKEEIRE